MNQMNGRLTDIPPHGVPPPFYGCSFTLKYPNLVVGAAHGPILFVLLACMYQPLNPHHENTPTSTDQTVLHDIYRRICYSNVALVLISESSLTPSFWPSSHNGRLLFQSSVSRFMSVGLCLYLINALALIVTNI